MFLVSSPSVSAPVVIVNPKSGAGLSPRKWARLAGTLTDGLGPFEARFTEGRGDGRRLAREASLAGATLVVAFGGDGTISEVANGLVDAGRGTQLGIIPRGTGGDLRRSLDLPGDVGEAARRIRDAPPRLIDAGRVTFTAPDGGSETRHFLNVASFGFSSTVAQRANESSKALGAKASFLSATLRSLVTYDNIDVLLSADEQPARRMTLLFGAVGNGCYFGGGMKVCPEGCLDDGLLELVTVGDLGRLELLAKISRVYAGTHLGMSQVEHTRLRRLHVTPATPGPRIPLELDGETPGHLPATFEIIPAALPLRA